jgi:hypothetical protein
MPKVHFTSEDGDVFVKGGPQVRVARHQSDRRGLPASPAISDGMIRAGDIKVFVIGERK